MPDTWEKSDMPQIWRGCAGPFCDPVEGGLIWLNHIPFIVRQDPWLGITLIAVDPKTLERRTLCPQIP